MGIMSKTLAVKRIIRNVAFRVMQGNRLERSMETKVSFWDALADAIHDFGSGMQRPVPAQRTGLAEWKVEIVDCVQDLYNEALFPECSFFCEMKGNGLNVFYWSQIRVKTLQFHCSTLVMRKNLYIRIYEFKYKKRLTYC